MVFAQALQGLSRVYARLVRPRDVQPVLVVAGCAGEEIHPSLVDERVAHRVLYLSTTTGLDIEVQMADIFPQFVREEWYRYYFVFTYSLYESTHTGTTDNLDIRLHDGTNWTEMTIDGLGLADDQGLVMSAWSPDALTWKFDFSDWGAGETHAAVVGVTMYKIPDSVTTGVRVDASS